MEEDKEFSKTCVAFEKEKHPWLSDAQAKRIVEDNLLDDPDFYAFLGEDDELSEGDEEIVEDEEIEEDAGVVEEDAPKEKTGPTLIEVSFGIPVSNKD